MNKKIQPKFGQFGLQFSSFFCLKMSQTEAICLDLLSEALDQSLESQLIGFNFDGGYGGGSGE